MFLKGTEHVGFKRFKLNPIQRFKYTPEHALTFIIGTNGAGKSSLIGEWDPSPKSSTDYKPGGSCTQFFEDRGHEYELRSEFDLKGGAKHHFIRDGVPLNNGEVGGTAKVQKDLVAKYFNFDKELHKVLCGTTSFTKMTAKQRERVITELSNCDLGWAFGVYNDLQSQIRNSKGTQKDLAVTTAQDKQRLTSFHIDSVLAEQEKLRGELKQLTGYLLTGVRNNVAAQRDEYITLCREVEERITRYIRGTNSSIDTLGITSEEELLNEITLNQSRVNALSNQISQLSNQAAQAEETYERLSKTLGLSSGELEQEIKDTQEALESLPKHDERFSSYDSTPNDYILVERDLGLFITTHNELLPLKDTEDRVQQAELWLRSHPEQVRGLEKEINQHRMWLSHLENHDAVNCPECNHEFMPGIDPKEKPSREAEILRCEKTLESLERHRITAEEMITHMRNAQAQRHKLIEIFAGIPEQAEIRDDIFSEKITLSMALMKIKAIRDQYERQLNSAAQRERLTQQLDRLLKIQKQTQETNLQEEVERQKQLFENALKRVEEEQDKLLVETERQRALSAVKAQFELQTRIVEQSSREQERLEGLANELVRFEINQFIENLMNEVHDKLAKTQQIITDYNTLSSNIKRLEEIEADAKARQEELELAAKALSPLNGIIADQLKDHINVLITHMNQIVSNIWEHNLEILPCGLNNNKLDYTFPVYVGSDPDVTPDIAYCSKGEREVIDLAFSIVLMLQRGIIEYPLYLDEIASSFDKKHRTNFMEFLNELVANKKISQIFMINHYSDMYGIAGDHDVVVLDTTNVVLPERYNDRVEIT